MKVLVINCGSSSLKYQLIDMEGERVLCKGLCERIGIEGSKITHKANGGEWEQEVPFPTHTEAFMKVVEMMTSGEGAVVKDKSEISAIGHRVVQGAEFFTKSEIVTCAGPAQRQGRVRRKGAQRCRFRHHLPPDHAQKGVYVRRAV